MHELRVDECHLWLTQVQPEDGVDTTLALEPARQLAAQLAGDAGDQDPAGLGYG